MKQKQALDILKSGRNVYLTGAAGSGKTHIINEYISYLRDRGVRPGVTASTGIAATHIGGVTIHSWSGVGIRDELSDNEIELLIQKEYLWKRYDKTDVLIIDEVSMLGPYLFDTIERVCRAMKGNDKPFGGMQIILSGDFFQLPPIVRNGFSVEFIDSSNAWEMMDIRVCYLDEQFRHNDNTLESILGEMRGGDVSDRTREIFEKMKGKKFVGDIIPTRLFTHNVDVDALNNKELEKISGEKEVYTMETKGKSNVVASMKKSILAPEELHLKVDAVVMFVKNNFEAGYVNGTLGIIEKFDGRTPLVRTFSGEKIYANPVEWMVEEDGKVLGSVTQIPLRLAWAITIHKSQGMTMDAAEIDLSKSFVPGQGYVAISRLRNLEGLSLIGINNMSFAVNPDVLDLDRYLKSESTKWEKVIGRFSEDDIRDMHKEFVLNCGGTVDKKEIDKNKNREVEGLEKKIPTHEKTLSLVQEGLSLKEIAKSRGMTVGTIISHFEKLKELKIDFDLKKFKPKADDLKKIKEAFKVSKDMKLSPVHKKLKGKYTYEELRLARLFV